MRSGEDRDGTEEDNYFREHYDLEIDEIGELFTELNDSEAFTQQQAFELFTLGLELGYCIKEIRSDLN